jgi:hypothetical protein
MPVKVNKSLRECLLIVRISMDDTIAVGGMGTTGSKENR